MAMELTKKVLLAEDDAAMQAALRTLLEIEGFTVAVATVLQTKNIIDLLHFIRAEQPDVVLLDYHLGQSNGLDVLRLLREDPAIAHTRVIMTSGMDVQDRCLAASAEDFVLKPFMPDELVSKLRG